MNYHFSAIFNIYLKLVITINFLNFRPPDELPKQIYGNIPLCGDKKAKAGPMSPITPTPASPLFTSSSATSATAFPSPPPVPRPSIPPRAT